MAEATAAGSRKETRRFNVLVAHDRSSLLELHVQHPFSTAIERVINVLVTTVDSYADEHGLAHIDLLKIDTQGFDLEVLRGASETLRRRACLIRSIRKGAIVASFFKYGVSI